MDAFVQERWQKDREYLLNGLKEAGFDVMLEAAQGDSKLQLQQVQKLLQNGVKLLIVVPADSKQAAKIVEAAHKANVKVIAYDRLIKNCDLDYYVSTDNIEIGTLQANYLVKHKSTGNYAIIGGPTTDNNSYLIRLGQLNVLEPYIEKGDIKIVYDEFVETWTEEDGMAHMEKCLQSANNKIDVVLAANDDLAHGVIRALEKAGLAGKVLVGGQDADLKACQLIISGKQTITIYKPIKTMAFTAVELASKLAKNEQITTTMLSVNNGKKMVPTIILHATVVNKQNMKLTVVADDYLSEKDIYK